MTRIINRIVVHHSESPRSTSVQDIAKWYIVDNGWSQIGYHKVIEMDGSIKNGRPESITGAHAAKGGWNHNRLGVCITGNFDKESPYDKQWQSLYIVLRDWCNDYDVEPAKIFGHCDAPGETKTCPGKFLYMHLPVVRKYVTDMLKATS